MHDRNIIKIGMVVDSVKNSNKYQKMSKKNIIYRCILKSSIKNRYLKLKYIKLRSIKKRCIKIE